MPHELLLSEASLDDAANLVDVVTPLGSRISVCSSVGSTPAGSFGAGVTAASTGGTEEEAAVCPISSAAPSPRHFGGGGGGAAGTPGLEGAQSFSDLAACTAASGGTGEAEGRALVLPPLEQRPMKTPAPLARPTQQLPSLKFPALGGAQAGKVGAVGGGGCGSTGYRGAGVADGSGLGFAAAVASSTSSSSTSRVVRLEPLKQGGARGYVSAAGVRLGNKESNAWSALPQEPCSSSAAQPPSSQQGRQKLLRELVCGLDARRVRELVDAGTSVNAPHRGGATEPQFVTLLHSLCSMSGPFQLGSLEVLKVLLRARANVNPRSSAGCTPLIRACMRKHVGAAQLLLEWRADITACDEKGLSPVKYALMLDPPRKVGDRQHVQVDVPKVVIQPPEEPSAGVRDCDLEDVDIGPLNPPALFHGEGSVSAELVRLLLESGPPQAVEKILGPELNVGAAPRQRTSVRASSNRPSIRGQLPGALARSNTRGLLGGELGLGIAATASSSPCHQAGAQHQEPLLLTAVKLLNHEAAAVLIEVGKLPALWLNEAVKSRSLPLVKTLLQGRADPMAQNEHGDSPMDTALQSNDRDDEIVDALREFAKARGLAPQDSKPSEPLRQRTRASSARPDAVGGEACGSSEDSGPAADAAAKGVRWRLRSLIAPYVSAFAHASSELSEHRWFHCFQVTLLFAGLVISDLWVLLDAQGENTLDAMLLVVFAGFVFELLVQAIGRRAAYLLTFFFYMDIVGACSLLLDISMFRSVIAAGDGVGENAVVMRAARAARLGARAGRFTRLVKLLRFLPGFAPPSDAKNACTAKFLAGLLVSKLSTLVSCLIILLAMVLPLFQVFTYPVQDWSMQMWTSHLAAHVPQTSISSAIPEELQEVIDDFRADFVDRNYFPHTCRVHLQRNGTQLLWTTRGKLSERNQLRVSSGDVVVLFDFGGVNRAEAAANLAVILVTVCLIFGFSLVISKSVSTIALTPLGQVMWKVRALGSALNDMVDKMYKASMYRGTGPEDAACAERDLDEDMARYEDNVETAMLEKVVRKLETLIAITKRQDAEEELETLMYFGEARGGTDQPRRLPSKQSRMSCFRSEESADRHGAVIADRLEAVRSWDFNALSLDRPQSCSITVEILQWIAAKASSLSKDTLAAYVDAACAGYKQGPQYHNWLHAVDVTHVLFMVLYRCSRQGVVMTILEEFALLASAVCHDIGHPGVNNDFLVKTSDALAICYNDLSPLENMHCSRMFEIVTRPRTEVFGELHREQYHEVRSICVAAILHTDNVHHMPMVKKLQVFDELHTELLVDAQDVYNRRREANESGDAMPADDAGWPTKELSDMLWEGDNRPLLRNLVFHFADINNTTRPFAICKEWAILVLEEFFSQGDSEKQLGLPVGPLNDREKLNRAFSQIGFIDFFAAPFVFATVRLLPPLQELSDQLIENTRTWVDEWVQEEGRTEDEVQGVLARLKRLEERNAALKPKTLRVQKTFSNMSNKVLVSLRATKRMPPSPAYAQRPVAAAPMSPTPSSGGDSRVSPRASGSNSRVSPRVTKNSVSSSSSSLVLASGVQKLSSFSRRVSLSHA